MDFAHHSTVTWSVFDFHYLGNFAKSQCLKRSLLVDGSPNLTLICFTLIVAIVLQIIR